jgi:hypothetical protein
MKYTNKQCILLFVLCSLLFASCDLFTGPKVNLLKQISDEVDWANAPKLTVSVAFPQAWGTSNPQQGVITPAKDIRKGYPFEIEFTPDTAWSFNEWRAYRSPLPEGWTANLTLLDGLERLDGVSVEVPTLPPRGGAGSFKINTTEAVTLVPWCKREPYVTRTVPGNSPSMIYPRVKDIEIYFNAPLVLDADIELPELFTSETIKITAGGNKISTDNSCYNYPVYKASADSDEYTITISATGNVPGDSVIEVTVGPGIYNAAGYPMSRAFIFSFGTSQGGAGGGIDTWDASYDGNSITFNWTTTETVPGAVTVEARYRVNKGWENTLSGGSPRTIHGVNPPDYSGVREGRSVSGIQEYEVFLDLYLEGIKSNVGSKSFKIWNIPGMSINQSNAVFLDNDNFSTALTASASSEKFFLLTEDITISGMWTPVGSAAYYTPPNPGPGDELYNLFENTYWSVYPPEIKDGSGAFKGKFYGNGHKITIGGGLNTANGGEGACAGLFGAAVGAEIRDLTLAYNGSITGVPVTGDFAAGSIVGYAVDTSIRNVITTGVDSSTALTVAPSGDAIVRFGGIAGYIGGSGIIENCFAGLSTKYTSSGHTGEVRMGAAAGETGVGSGKSIKIYNGYTLGTAVQGPNVTLSGLIVDRVTVAAKISADKGANEGILSIGGAVGRSTENTVSNIIVSGSEVSFAGTSGNENHVGGVTGNAVRSNMENCSFADSSLTTINSTAISGTLYFGGLIGYNCNIIPHNISIATYINNCRVKGNIELVCNDDSNTTKSISGVLGFSYDTFSSPKPSITITNCFFDDGNIRITGSNIGTIHVGGFGDFAGSAHYVYKCGSMAGSIDVNIPDGYGSISAGGFAPYLQTSVSHCFSRTNIDTSGILNQHTGGFVGYSYPYTDNDKISSCYASGNVRSTLTDWGDLDIGGFAGSSYGVIENCYALGDVLAEKTANIYNTVNAGGLVGLFNGQLKYSFSAGTVRCLSAGRNNNASAGGIVGSRVGGTITNTAALGDKVVAVAGNISQAQVGRIAGNSSSGLSNNYAIGIMTLCKDTYDNKDNPVSVSPSPAPALNNINGISIDNNDLRDVRFWLDINGLSFNYDGTKPGNDRFLNVWDVSSLLSGGRYPRLAWEQ